MASIRLLSSGYYHVRWSKYRWMQWPSWELPTLANGFGWITRTDVQEAAELLALLEEQERFCPACDAGAGHCNGPHKGSDEIGF